MDTTASSFTARNNAKRAAKKMIAMAVCDGVPPSSISVDNGGTSLMSASQPALAARSCGTSGTSLSRRAATDLPSATPDAQEPPAHRRGPSALACGPIAASELAALVGIKDLRPAIA
jgi:hypothetical protein